MDPLALVAVVSPPSSPSLPIFVWVLATIAAGSGGTLAYQAYIQHKVGRLEEEDRVTRITQQVIEGAGGLLEEYRIQQAALERQIDNYLSQLSELNRLLGEANARIGRLEDDLHSGMEHSRDLEQRLKNATSQRDALIAEIDELRDRIRELEEQATS